MAGQVRLSCVAAMDANRGIGKNNKLPWHLPLEMKYFTRLTSTVKNKGKQNVIIMGRKTWESIPAKYRPLPDRINIVLSKTLTAVPQGAHYMCSSLDDAIGLVSKAPLAETVERVFVTGGGVVYKDAMGHKCCHKLYLTKIDKDYDCDVFYPEFDENVYKPSSDEAVNPDQQEDKGVTYKICVYERQ